MFTILHKEIETLSIPSIDKDGYGDMAIYSSEIDVVTDVTIEHYKTLDELFQNNSEDIIKHRQDIEKDINKHGSYNSKYYTITELCSD